MVARQRRSTITVLSTFLASGRGKAWDLSPRSWVGFLFGYSLQRGEFCLWDGLRAGRSSRHSVQGYLPCRVLV
jgi:hypothetical protein